MRESEWSVKDADDNAASTATKAAVAGKRHAITGVTASYSGTAANKLLQLKSGTTVIWERYVTQSYDAEFDSPLLGELGGAVSAELAASGTGGTTGTVTIKGYTEG